ncbi:2999_t:CDS:2, partial [Paraglomus occultum]
RIFLSHDILTKRIIVIDMHEENGLAVVKEKISSKKCCVVGLDDKEDWEELGASRRMLKHKIEADAEVFFKNMKESLSPSDLAKAKNWQHEQSSNAIYLNHRPADASGNPVSLQHHIFATFLDACETITPEDVDYAFVGAAAESMSMVHANEDARERHSRRCIEITTISALTSTQTGR